jgi:hypothetical protein
MVRRRKKAVATEEEIDNKKSLVYPIGDIIFNSRRDYTYFLKLDMMKNDGLIESFDPSSLYYIEDAVESKYNAKKIIINGEKLDSRLEADYYLYLLELKRENNIVDFDLKPTFILQPAFVKNGVKFSAIKYIADFSVSYPDGTVEIVDTKGIITPDFALKKKIFEYNFPTLHLRILKFVQSMGGWIEFDEWKKIRKQRAKK